MTDRPGDTVSAGAVATVLEAQRSYEEQRKTRLGAGTEFLTGPFARLLAGLVGARTLESFLDAADKAAAMTIPAAISAHDTADIAACEAAAIRVQAWAQGTNAASGALAGWFGAAGLSADIAATLGLAARTVRATAACYGFTGDSEEERAYRMLVLECATASAGERRREVLARMQRGAEHLNDPVMRAGVDRAMDWVGEKVVDRIARQLGVSLGGRGAGRIVPILGGAVAATVNASFQADVARAARYGYRLRWLMSRRLLPEVEAPAEVKE